VLGQCRAFNTVTRALFFYRRACRIGALIAMDAQKKFATIARVNAVNQR